jgi:putative endopeptidase
MFRSIRRSLTGSAFACFFPAAALAATAASTGPPLAKDPLVQDMDRTVNPGVDFSRYANGRWLKAHPIPPSENSWGIGSVVYEETYRQRREICETASRSDAGTGTHEQKVGDFWVAGMDSVAIERRGLAPLKPDLDRIATIRSRADLIQTIARLHRRGIESLYGMYVGQDERNSERYLVHLVQGGIRLPDRGYYVDRDSSTARIRGLYRQHVAAMFRLLGETPAAAKRSSDVVFRIETALAQRSRTIEERRDPWANYHKLSMAQLAALTPSLDWKRTFAEMGLPAVDTVVVGQPEFLQRADSLLAKASLDDWKTVLRWDLVNSLANRLPRALDRENFHFYGTVMSGTQAQRPRWKRVIDAEEDGIGELLGEVWVAKYCSPATKARYEKLTADIIDAYRERIRHLDWMSEPTKRRALVKLDHVARKVAYPDKWRDYSALKIGRDSYAGNQLAVNEWWFHHEAAKLGKPVDRTEWDMTPQTYNAYYDGSKVEIVLPAACFMIPGLPDSLMDDALLYSYAGASTIGHEITHGFDDEGRQSDERGNLNPWWIPQDSVRFTERAKKLAEQFNEYRVGDKHVRGYATLGENIADLGGVRLGYEAFKKTDQWKRGVKVNGLTPDQRFFLGYALSWMGQRRPESLATLIMTNVHAPEFLRINGPLANMPEFYAAFGVKPGDPMYRADDVRVQIW